MDNKIEKPIIFHEGRYRFEEIIKFIKKNKPQIKDIYAEQIQELFEINNADKIFDNNFSSEKLKFAKKIIADKSKGTWIYYSWNNIFTHILCEEDYYKLRTNRNRNLISQDEQLKLKDTRVGVVGLSIGAAFARNLVQQGIGKYLKMAEFDILATSNLNRIFARAFEVGQPKLRLISEQIYEIDPYWNLELYPQGLDELDFGKFLIKPNRVDIILEAIDNLKIKIKLRIAARHNKIPVVMFTNLGDSVMIDVERFDLNSNADLFNGIIGDVPEKILADEIDSKNINKYVTELVSVANTPKRALDSLALIGKELVGRPQLSSSVNISGGLSSYVCRKIILKENLPSGRFIWKFDSIFKN